MIIGELVNTITSDGLELKGFWADKKSDVAVFHSHGTAGDFYTHGFIEPEAEKLLARGISFLTANNRGHDVYADIRKHNKGKVEWVQIGGAFEKFEDCVFDIGAWIDFLQRQGVKKVILQAHSLTQKILYYQDIKHDPRVAAQIHISPCNDAGYMYFTLGEKKYEETNKMVKKMIKEGKTKDILPSQLSVVCPMGPQPYYDYLTEEGIGNLFPYHNSTSSKWRVLGRTKDPLLMIFGEADAFIKPSPKEAAEILKQKATSAVKFDVHLIKNASHSYLGFEDELIDVISNWVSLLKPGRF